MAQGQTTRARSPEEEVSRAIARIKAGILAVICGLLGGTALFVATAWLLIKGGPRVGEHLQLLRHYFLGYSVSWPGAFVGFFYGALVGAAIGWTIGMIYNRIVGIRFKS